MQSSNSSQIGELVSTAGEALQELQNLLGRSHRTDAKVRFPRGYLTELGTRRDRLRFLRSDTVRNNVAYTLMLYEVHSWILRRTDLAGLANDMVVKSCLAALGSVTEALLTDATSPPL